MTGLQSTISRSWSNWWKNLKIENKEKHLQLHSFSKCKLHNPRRSQVADVELQKLHMNEHKVDYFNCLA